MHPRLRPFPRIYEVRVTVPHRLGPGKCVLPAFQALGVQSRLFHRRSSSFKGRHRRRNCYIAGGGDAGGRAGLGDVAAGVPAPPPAGEGREGPGAGAGDHAVGHRYGDTA